MMLSLFTHHRMENKFKISNIIIIDGDDVRFSGSHVNFAVLSSLSRFQIQLAKELGRFIPETSRHYVIVLQQLFIH